MEALSYLLLLIGILISITTIRTLTREQKKYINRDADWHFRKKEIIQGGSILAAICLVGSCWAMQKNQAEDKSDSTKVSIQSASYNNNSTLVRTTESAINANSVSENQTPDIPVARSVLIDSLTRYDISYNLDLDTLSTGEERLMGHNNQDKNSLIEFIGSNNHLKKISWIMGLRSSGIPLIGAYTIINTITDQSGGQWLQDQIVATVNEPKKSWKDSIKVNNEIINFKYLPKLKIITVSVKPEKN